MSARRDDGRWDVTSKLGTEAYDAVVVANGHHWSPNRPIWPGQLDGPVIHAHDYRTPTDPVDMTGKRVLVVGLGNSAVDIAAELAQRTVTKRLFVSARRGCLGATQDARRSPDRQDAAAVVDPA